MAEFVKVVTEHKRMCENFKMCGKCPLGKEHGLGTQCRMWVVDHPEETEQIVMQWAEEHPVVTNSTKFEEIFGVPFWAISCGVTPAISKWLRSEYKEAKK